jgi:hypothetical protein
MPNLLKDKRRILLIINVLVISSLIFVYFMIVLPNRQKQPDVLGAAACGTNAIGGTVFEDKNSNGRKDSGEPGIQGITVNVFKPGGKVGTTTTDSSGNYVMTVTKGTQLRVEFGTISGSNVFYPGPSGTDSRTSVRFLTANGNCDVNFGVVRLGASETVEVGNRVWRDSNKNGLQDPDEQGIAGVTVRLYKEGQNSAIATTKTNSAGEYFFKGGGLVPNGSYTIRLDNPADYSTGPLKDLVLTASNQGGSDLIDSDARNANGYPQISFDVGICDLCNHNNDFGFKPDAQPTATPTATATQRPTNTATPSPRPSNSPTPTQRPSSTPTATPTATPRPSSSPSVTATATATPTATPSPTPTSTPSPTPSPSPSPSPSPTPTSTPSATPTTTATTTPVITGTNVSPTPPGSVLGADTTRVPRELPNTGLADTAMMVIGTVFGTLLIANGTLLGKSKRGVKIRIMKENEASE